jgi:hypothetical protein
MMRLPKLLTAGFGQGSRRAHAGELGFRDFSSLSLVRENRRQLGNPACCNSIDNYHRQPNVGICLPAV